MADQAKGYPQQYLSPDPQSPPIDKYAVFSASAKAYPEANNPPSRTAMNQTRQETLPSRPQQEQRPAVVPWQHLAIPADIGTNAAGGDKIHWQRILHPKDKLECTIAHGWLIQFSPAAADERSSALHIMIRTTGGTWANYFEQDPNGLHQGFDALRFELKNDEPEITLDILAYPDPRKGPS